MSSPHESRQVLVLEGIPSICVLPYNWSISLGLLSACLQLHRMLLDIRQYAPFPQLSIAYSLDNQIGPAAASCRRPPTQECQGGRRPHPIWVSQCVPAMTIRKQPIGNTMRAFPKKYCFFAQPFARKTSHLACLGRKSYLLTQMALWTCRVIRI